MQRILTSILILVVALSANAQSDTVKVADNINQVIVTKRDDGRLNVTLKGKPNNTTYSYSYSAYPKPADKADTTATEPLLPMVTNEKKHKTWTPLWVPGCNVGFIAATGDNDLGMKTSRSWEIGVSMFGVKYRPWRQKSYFTATVDIAVKTFSTGKSNYMLSGYKPLQLLPSEQGYRVKSNSVELWQFSVPVMYHQNIAKKFEFGLGAQVNWNWASYGHTKYESNSKSVHYSQTLKQLNQQPFTVDVIATLGWRGDVQFYAKYSPMSVYASDFGPNMQTLSFGLRFGF